MLKEIFNRIICFDDSIKKINIEEMQQFQSLTDIIPPNEFIDFMKILIINTAKLWQVWYIHPELIITDEKYLLDLLLEIL
jgi:hypothetical protein